MIFVNGLHFYSTISLETQNILYQRFSTLTTWIYVGISSNNSKVQKVLEFSFFLFSCSTKDWAEKISLIQSHPVNSSLNDALKLVIPMGLSFLAPRPLGSAMFQKEAFLHFPSETAVGRTLKWAGVKAFLHFERSTIHLGLMH